MTDHDRLMAAVLSPDVKQAAALFVDELVASTMLAVRQDPRAYGFVTLKEHDARVAELLEANSREVERRRAAESTEATLAFTMDATGRVKVKSEAVPGLFLASTDLQALLRDLKVAIPDLLRANIVAQTAAACPHAELRVAFIDESQNTYAGTGGLEGPPEMRGQYKPRLVGVILNGAPYWLDGPRHIFQIHDGALAAVSAVYDRGMALTYAGDVVDILAAGCLPGHFITQLSGGFIRLGSNPAGLVTVDAEASAQHFDVLTAVQSLPFGCGAAPTEIPADVPDKCAECGWMTACIQHCGQAGCPVMAARKAVA
jgi:hypothetical protein